MDRSSARPVALAPLVVFAAGLFTLFAVSYFAVQTSMGVAMGARYEKEEERAQMIGYVLGGSGDRPDLDVHRAANVMAWVPRHRFVPEAERQNAYLGTPLSIGSGRTTPARKAAATLGDLGYGNVTVREGWAEHAPFDSIVVNGAVDRVPQPLIDQVAAGGRLVAPVGPADGVQELQVLEKHADGSVRRSSHLKVRFPPLIRDR